MRAHIIHNDAHGRYIKITDLKTTCIGQPVIDSLNRATIEQTCLQGEFRWASNHEVHFHLTEGQLPALMTQCARVFVKDLEETLRFIFGEDLVLDLY